MVTKLAGISPDVKIKAIFAVPQARGVDAAAGIFDDVRIQAVLGKTDVVAAAVLRSDDVRIPMRILFAQLTQIVRKGFNEVMRERRVFFYLSFIL